MNYILQIDCSNDDASVSIAAGGELLAAEHSSNKREHASFLHPALERITRKTNISLAEVDAIAVVNGPGSYTGLRVGLSTAKGLCFALSKPLITISTLEVLAKAAIDLCKDPDGVYIPLIDARRMEVFTATYNSDLQLIKVPEAHVITEYSFQKGYEGKKLYFFGDGLSKTFPKISHNNKLAIEDLEMTKTIASLSNLYFLREEFSDLNYTEPFYLKAFYQGN